MISKHLYNFHFPSKIDLEVQKASGLALLNVFLSKFVPILKKKFKANECSCIFFSVKFCVYGNNSLKKWESQHPGTGTLLKTPENGHSPDQYLS